jgi:hypothetical protein
MIIFKDIEINDQEKINEYISVFNSEVSELSFTNLYAWREKYGFRFTVVENFLWIMNQTAKGRVYFSPPIGDYDKNFHKSLKSIKEYCNERDMGFIIKKASESVKDRILTDTSFEYEVNTNRDSSDYVYLFDDLRTLSGNKFHKKKNRVNKFLKTYDHWTYEIIDDENLDDCRLFADQWCEENNCDRVKNLKYERKAIKEVLDNYHVLNCYGGIIRVNNEFAGFTISEALNDETLVVHFEKADTKFSGIYNILSNEHLKQVDQSFIYVNREQDLGIDGLRRSKMSYHPIKLVHKYQIKIL